MNSTVEVAQPPACAEDRERLNLAPRNYRESDHARPTQVT